MPNFASVTLIGHLGRDPEVRTTNSGEKVASFSIATSRKRGENETTTWWNCSVWGKRADVIAQYVKKGDPLHIVGEPVMRPYTDNQGYEAVSLDVFVQDFTLLGNRRDGAQNGSGGDSGAAPRRRPAETQQNAPAGSGDIDDDIPFNAHMRGAEYL